MHDPGNVFIYDEEESRQATAAQMQQTARRFGIGGHDQIVAPLPVSQTVLAPQPFAGLPFEQQLSTPPVYVPQPGVLAQPIEHLLVTPAGKEGQARIVRMSGAQKLEAWTISSAVVPTVAAILASFHINLTDLREDSSE